jgi:hypothetical protein
MVQILPERPSFGQQFGRSFGAGLGKGFSDMISSKSEERSKRQLQAEKLRGDYKADEKNYDKIQSAFGPKFADIWRASPQGARTQLTKAALEARARGLDLDKMLSGITGEPSSEERSAEPSFEMPEEKQEKRVDDEIKKIKQEQDKELLTPEKIARGKERYATGLKEYQEAGIKLRSAAEDKQRIGILEDIENNNKLPKGFGRVNVDKNGNLRIPFLSSPDAQRFVKTLNEFSAGAKGTFGARVTNFDLAQFMKRYPTLLNDADTRKQLYQQMKLINQLNSIFYKNLKNVYNKAGGVRNIDSDVAERLAEQITEPQLEKLSKKFSKIGKPKENELPEGTVLMQDPNGNPLHVPKDQVDKLLSLGATLSQ